MSFSDFKVPSLKARLPNGQRGMSVLVIGILAHHLLVARCQAPPEVFIAMKKTILFPLTISFFSVGDDLIHEAALLSILKGKPPLWLT